MSLEQINLPLPQTEASATLLPRSQGDWNKTTERQAIVAATGLSKCWRKDEAHDPETFGLAVAAVFTLYSPDVVQFVCDPRTGLPKTHRWPPAISEVHSACSDRVADLARIKRFKNWGQHDPDEVERRKDQGVLPPPNETKPTLAELHAKHGPNWGLGGVLPANEILMQTTGARPMTRDQAFIEKVRAEGNARRAAEAEQTMAFHFGCERREQRRDQPARPIVGADGVELDQGADF